MEANKMESSKPSPVTPKVNPPEMNSRQDSGLRQVKKDAPVAAKSTAFEKSSPVSPIQAAAPMQSDWVADIRTHAEGMDQTLQSFVKKSPFAAVAIAVGVGFAGSLIFNKFNSSEKSTKELS